MRWVSALTGGFAVTGSTLILCCQVVSATTISVTTTADDTTVNGNCTLREAVIAANTNAAVDACAAGGASDTITVPAGTYTLTLTGAGENAAATGDLDITDDVEIDGAGVAGTVIDGNLTDRVFDVDPTATGVTATLRDMTITNGVAPVSGNGSTGGGVLSAGTLTVVDVRITGNRAGGAPIGQGGGISSAGSLTVSHSSVCNNTASTIGGLIPPVSANGGGIASLGALQIDDSTICDNIAIGELAMPSFEAIAAGAGLASSGAPATIRRTTISGNHALGGGMFSVAFGAGVALTADATLLNCTVSDNLALPVLNSSASGVATAAPLTFTLGNCTVSNNNGGGIAGTGSTAVLRNSIVANNAGGDCVGVVTVSANAYNLDRDSSCDLSGTDLPGVDPLLGPLQNNGGPTFTRALLTGSPAKDAGNPAAPGSGGSACASTDQRGVIRPQDTACDIGAFEVEGVAPFILDHYKCYQGKDLRNPSFARINATLQDQFGTQSVEVNKVKYVCTPVDKNGEGIPDSSAHLTCYLVKALQLMPRPQVQISSQFQASRFEAKKAKLLCVPSTKTIIP